MTRPQSEIYFYHIPKTAGTSLAGMIRRAFPLEKCVPAHWADELLRLPREQVPNYRCYTGHFYSLLDHLVGRKLPTVTLLRDPFEHSVSFLRHVQRDRNVGRVARRDWALWHDFPILRRWLQPGWCALLMNNFQTRALGVDLTPPKTLSRGLYEPMNELRLPENSTAMEKCFERAIARLEEMAVVGTVERFAESASLIFDRLGVPLPDAISHDNASETREGASNYRTSGTISEALVRLIDSQNAYDRKLYQIASARLDADLAARTKADSLSEKSSPLDIP